MVDTAGDFDTYLAQCSDGDHRDRGRHSPCRRTQSQCGNANIDAPERCDGANLNGASCVTFGFAAGSLGCSAGCTC